MFKDSQNSGILSRGICCRIGLRLCIPTTISRAGAVPRASVRLQGRRWHVIGRLSRRPGLNADGTSLRRTKAGKRRLNGRDQMHAGSSKDREGVPCRRVFESNWLLACSLSCW